ncbi:MAG: hypothetical protein OEV08_08510 [Nitrospira sp.]|nr:hypothetical protein [Nitrospira sp.]
MAEHELEKLLGGFAPDTLTADEKQQLFAAALHDQQLFNALADEQALKELLADPAVRQRLLRTLKETRVAGAGGSRPWIDWFRRPANLALAGGLATALFAVVLGTKVYQDSLKHAAQSAAKEDVTPAAPAAAPPLPTNEDMEAAPIQAKKEPPPDSLALRERLSPRKEQPRESTRDNLRRRSEEDRIQPQTASPGADLGRIAAEAPAATAPPLANTSDQQAAPAAARIPAQLQIADKGAPAISARTLFYGTESRYSNSTKESLAEPSDPTAPPPKLSALESFQERNGLGLSKAIAPLTVLGLRYSFVVRGNDGQDREVDAAAAAKGTAQASLTLETNQDAYLQVWKTVGAATPQLLVPDKSTGQISRKTTAGQRLMIPLPKDIEPVTLTVRISRAPFGPITRQEAAMFNRLAPDQLLESISPKDPGHLPEQATYIVSQDPSPATQISVEIPPGR